MSNIINSIWNATRNYFSEENTYKRSISKIPYLGDINSDFNDTHSNKLTTLLEKYAPELLSRLYGVVLMSALEVKEKEEELETLREQKIALEEDVARKDELYKQTLDKIPEKPGSRFFMGELLLTFGLSILLFIGIYNIFGLVPQQASKLKNLPQTILALAGAICINLAEKNSIERHVEYHNEVKDEIQKNEEKKRPYWERMLAGEQPIFLAVFIVIAEMGFTASGLFTLIDDDFFTRFTAVLGTSLAAVINVAQAWGLAIKKAKWKKDNLNKLDQINEEKIKIKSEAEADRAKLKGTERQIKNLETKIRILQKKATIEYIRWEKDLKRFMKVKPFDSET